MARKVIRSYQEKLGQKEYNNLLPALQTANQNYTTEVICISSTIYDPSARGYCRCTAIIQVCI